MITEINIADLRETNHGSDFSDNDTAEQLVINAFCSKYNVQDNGGTVGNVPEYDWTLNDSTVEIKMSGNPNLFIEFGNALGKPSGLEVTTSDVHMFINPASAIINGNWVDMMKVRLIRTSELKVWLDYMAKRYEEDHVVHQPSRHGKGSVGFYLNLKNHKGPDINDLFMMGFEYRKTDSGQAIMDTQKIIMPNNRYAANTIHEFIE